VVFLYAGRLDVEKHVDVIVDAFQQVDVPGAQLILTGEGPHRQKLEERARSVAGLRIIPYLQSRDSFARLLASADVYVTAGPHETFGLSVVEAQACGLPVVGVDAGALQERVPPEVGFLGPVDDAEAMARNLEAAAAQRRTLGERARQHVLDEGLGWDSTFRQLFRDYEETWQSRASATPGESEAT